MTQERGMFAGWPRQAEGHTVSFFQELSLVPIPFQIEIPQVSEEVYEETRRAVEATGVFIVPIRPLSIQDLLKEDEKRRESRFSNWITPSKILWATVPPEMEVFVDPKNARIEDSNSLPTDEQREKIAQAEAEFKLRLPKGVRPFVSLHMVDPSTYAQIEDVWMDAGGGFLFSDFFARTVAETVPGGVADIGRLNDPHLEGSDRRRIIGHNRNLGHRKVFAVPVGVLPRKLKL